MRNSRQAGRPRLNQRLPKYCSEWTDAWGKTRWKLRRTGLPTMEVHVAPGTPEFTEAYHAWLNQDRSAVTARPSKPGTFNDLIDRFYRSSTWANIPKDVTRHKYRGVLEGFRKDYGDANARLFQAVHVDALLAKGKDHPHAANTLKKRLSQLMDFAILIGWRTDNPCRAVRAIRIEGDGYRTWTEADVATFEAAYAVGTRERLAFDLLLYTGQRRGDVIRMGPGHIADGYLRVDQEKGGERLFIPVHPALARSIAAHPSGHLTFLVTDRGRPFTPAYFGNWFRKACDRIGLDDLSAHGLRKTMSCRLAEAGSTNKEVQSVTGHQTDAMVRLYTKRANQKALAANAISKLNRE